MSDDDAAPRGWSVETSIPSRGATISTHEFFSATEKTEIEPGSHEGSINANQKGKDAAAADENANFVPSIREQKTGHRRRDGLRYFCYRRRVTISFIGLFTTLVVVVLIAALCLHFTAEEGPRDRDRNSTVNENKTPGINTPTSSPVKTNAQTVITMDSEYVSTHVSTNTTGTSWSPPSNYSSGSFTPAPTTIVTSKTKDTESPKFPSEPLLWNERQSKWPSYCGQVGERQQPQGQRRLRVKRIFNGETGTLTRFPWQAHIQVVEQVKQGSGTLSTVRIRQCEGTLIKIGFVVTTASCFGTKEPKAKDYHVAFEDFVQIKSGSELVGVVKDIVVHEHFNEETRENDIALIKLFTEPNVETDLNPACLPNPKHSRWNNRTASVGVELLTSDATDGFRKITTVSRNECKSILKAAGGKMTTSINDKTMCAGGSLAGGCEGDEGSPAVFQVESSGFSYFVLLGIISVELEQRDCVFLLQYVPSFVEWIDNLVT